MKGTTIVTFVEKEFKGENGSYTKKTVVELSDNDAPGLYALLTNQGHYHGNERLLKDQIKRRCNN